MRGAAPYSQDLLAYCMETRPDVLVLMGPFVDSEHRQGHVKSLLNSGNEGIKCVT